MSKITYYPWQMQRWFASRSRATMTLAERGLYRECLDLMYAGETLSAEDPEAVRKMVGASPREFRQAWPRIVAILKSTVSEIFSHPVVVENLEHLAKKQEVSSRRGSLGARARWKRVDESTSYKESEKNTSTCLKDASSSIDRMPKAMHKQCLSNAQAMAIKIKNISPQTPPLPSETPKTGEKLPDVLPDIAAGVIDEIQTIFSEIWERHPKKTYRHLAEQEFSQIVSSRPDDPLMQAQLVNGNHAAHCETGEWQRDKGRFCPRLNAWLASGAWMYPPVLDTGDDFAAEPGEYRPSWLGRAD